MTRGLGRDGERATAPSLRSLSSADCCTAIGFRGGDGREFVCPPGQNRLLVTPTYMSKGRMKPSDLVIVDTRGNRLAGKRMFPARLACTLP